MNRVVVISPSVLVLCVVGFATCGCLGPRLTGVATFPRIEGIVAASPTPGEYGFADFDHAFTESGNKTFHDKIPVKGFWGNPIPFEAEGQAIALSIGNGTNFKFHGLLGSKLCLEGSNYSNGPRFCENATARGKIKKEQGEDTVFVEEGWAYVWSNPEPTRADSDWVSGGTKGSGFALEIVDGTLHRLYFLEGTEAWYRCPGGDEIPWMTPNEYINVSPGCVIDGPHDIGALAPNDPVRRFAEELPKMTTQIPH